MAAHARYVSHLADCDSCRRMVTELMLTSEVAFEESEHVATQDVAPSKPWWSAIAALFAPSVLRYAVPALLLLGIIVVALVATRERRGSADMVALNEQKQDDAAVSSKEAAHAPSSQAAPDESMGANHATTTTNNSANQPGAASNNTSSTGGMLAQNANTSEAPPVTSTTTTATPAPAGTRQDSAEREEDLNARVYDDRPKAAPAPPADSSTAARETVAKERAGEEQQARKQNNEPAQTGRTETADLARSKDEDKSNPSASGGSALGKTETSQPSSRAATRSRPAARRSESAAADNKTDSGGAAETRSVNGRRFRRQGNAWVDTAYSSSRSTTHVARGSEQYRALVADEPAIRSFAEQLGGEVIVVWKGKAYRIY